MRCSWKAFVFLSSAAAFAASVALADEPPVRRDFVPGAVGAESRVAVAQTIRTADVIGLPVRNKQGEKLGKIEDLVIDLHTGDVRYAALSFGGIVGIGSKHFAVPWEAMTFVFGQANNQSDRHFVFDATKEQLERAPGFDSSHWPNVADPKWSESIDRHYNVQRRPDATARNGDERTRVPVTYETVFRATKIKGMDVRNADNQNLGSVDELVLDVSKGHVRYVALSFGNAFTGGNKLFAVPISAITLNHANDKTFLTLHVSQEALKNAPGFDKSRWPDMADPNWAKDIDTFYERSAQRPTTRD